MLSRVSTALPPLHSGATVLAADWSLNLNGQKGAGRGSPRPPADVQSCAFFQHRCVTCAFRTGGIPSTVLLILPYSSYHGSLVIGPVPACLLRNSSVQENRKCREFTPRLFFFFLGLLTSRTHETVLWLTTNFLFCSSSCVLRMKESGAVLN